MQGERTAVGVEVVTVRVEVITNEATAAAAVTTAVDTTVVTAAVTVDAELPATVEAAVPLTATIALLATAMAHLALDSTTVVAHLALNSMTIMALAMMILTNLLPWTVMAARHHTSSEAISRTLQAMIIRATIRHTIIKAHMAALIKKNTKTIMLGTK